MFGRLKSAILGAVVVAAALVPLFGDPRQTPVTHAIWGRMLLRALDMTEAVRESTQASQVFATLSWRDSLSLTADGFSKGDGVAVKDEAGVKRVVAGATPGEVAYAVAVVQGGDYQFRLRLAGEPARPATAEIVAAKGGRTFKTLSFTPGTASGWAAGGPAHLDPGSYSTSVLLPPGAALERVEVAPGCVASVEPVGGWQATAVTTNDDIAVTALRAVDLESELPPAAAAIEIASTEFEVDEHLAGAEPGFAAEALRAGSKGLRGLVTVNLPEAGLYTLSVFGSSGAGQRWVADGCRKSVLCPSTSGSQWRVVMTQPMSAGRHTLAVTLGDGAVVERARLERKKATPADYVATLRRVGFDPGPDGPVSREKAMGAMGFVREQHKERTARLCGDPTLPEFAVTPGAQAAAATGSAGQPAPPAPNPPPAPPDVLGPSLLPPQPPASPVSPSQSAGSSSSR
jgi:hypothetical protein